MSFLAALALVSAACPQELEHASPDLRYEMGVRVQAMERAFERAAPELRAAALPTIDDSVSAFFSFDLQAAMRALDQARLSLTGQELHWSDSLALTPNAWLHEEDDSIQVTISQLYPAEIPERAIIRFSADESRHEVLAFPFTYELGPAKNWKRPPDAVGTWEEGSVIPTCFVEFGAKERSREFSVEVVSNARARARAAQGLRSERLEHLPGWVAATTRLQLEFLSQSLKFAAYETQLPSEAMLESLEKLLATADEDLQERGALRRGLRAGPRGMGWQQWVALPKDSEREVGRVFLSEKLESEQPPLIIALHGSGGSENMFFESYGAGKITRLANEAGWIVAAPRVSSDHDVVAFTKRMIELLDADPKRVFLVGHSMGAARLISQAAELQEAIRPAGMILLGGGRPVRNAEDLRALITMPVYLGWGELDFALSGATALRDQLQEAEAQQLTAKTIENSEHLTVVQVALDDCFVWMKRQLDHDSE